MKIGIYEDFNQQDQRVIRKALNGPDKVGLATPDDMTNWCHKVIDAALATARENQKGGGVDLHPWNQGSL